MITNISTRQYSYPAFNPQTHSKPIRIATNSGVDYRKEINQRSWSLVAKDLPIQKMQKIASAILGELSNK